MEKDMNAPYISLHGEPQGQGKFMNRTTGTVSTAAKFSTAFGGATTINI